MRKSEMRYSILAATKARSVNIYDMPIHKEENPAGGRDLITTNGGFLPSESW